MHKAFKGILILFIILVFNANWFYANASVVSYANNTNAKEYLITPTADGKNQVTHPDMVYFREGFHGYKYWMACTPYPYSNQKYENPYILVSNDGKNFVKPEGEGESLVPPPEDWAKGGHYSDTDMHYYNGKLVLHFVYNFKGIPGPSKFYRMESTDGVKWTTPQVTYLCSKTIEGYSPAYIQESYSTVKMWYVGGEGNFNFTQSKDNETTWQEVKNCIINMPNGWRTWHVDVVKSGKGYEGLMCTRNPEKKVRALFYIESIDGIAWNCSKQPIIYPSKSSWDDKEIYRATMIKDRGDKRIWYSALGTTGKWYIGYTVVGRKNIEIDSLYKWPLRRVNKLKHRPYIEEVQ